MAVAVETSFQQICDANGVPYSGALVNVYAAGTTTPLSVYSDKDLSIGAANPIVCAADGTHAMRYIATASYKVAVTTAAGAPLTSWSKDNIDPGVAIGSGALPIANGGTAGTTAAAARTNLGAAAATDMATAQSDISSVQTFVGYLLTTITRMASGTTAQEPVSANYGTRSDSTTGRFRWNNASTWRNVLTAGDWTAADMMAGGVVQVQVATPYTANTDIATAIPADDTIPQIGEGTEILTLTFTPKHTSSHLFVIATFGSVSLSAANESITALFKNSGLNAIQTTAHRANASSVPSSQPPLFYTEAPGSVTPIIYSVRAGPSAGTMRFNGTTSARLYGGTTSAQLWVIEVRG